ncbi:MAG: biotin/lipoyl-containing protein [Thermodesulfobacteriota bacterium]
MDFRLETLGNPHDFSAEKTAADEMSAKINGKELRITVTRISDFEIFLSITEDGRTRNRRVFVADASDGKWVAAGGLSRFYRDLTQEKARKGRKKGLAEGPKAITPPMPAVVVRIPVTVGDSVQAGDPVIVVSAMKMETTLMASFAGRVEKINAAVGDKVMPGEILVDIVPAEETQKTE